MLDNFVITVCAIKFIIIDCMVWLYVCALLSSLRVYVIVRLSCLFLSLRSLITSYFMFSVVAVFLTNECVQMYHTFTFTYHH